MMFECKMIVTAVSFIKKEWTNDTAGQYFREEIKDIQVTHLYILDAPICNSLSLFFRKDKAFCDILLQLFSYSWLVEHLGFCKVAEIVINFIGYFVQRERETSGEDRMSNRTKWRVISPSVKLLVFHALYKGLWRETRLSMEMKTFLPSGVWRNRI